MSEVTQLMIPLRSRLRISPRAFRKLCAANPQLRMERSARGELEVMPPAHAGTGGRNALLTYRLTSWAEADGTGKCFDSSAGFTLPNGAIRSPDTSWIAKNRWDALTPDQRDDFSNLCPDFVVELRSRSDRKTKLREKMQEYIDQGARLGWLLDPIDDEAMIFRPGQPVEVIKHPTSLSGEGVLPGFVLDLKGILFE